MPPLVPPKASTGHQDRRPLPCWLTAVLTTAHSLGNSTLRRSVFPTPGRMEHTQTTGPTPQGFTSQ